MNEEIIDALKDRFGDQHLASGYCHQLKTRIQDDGESLQEVPTATEHLTHRTPVQHENHIRRKPGKTFVNDIGERRIKQQ
jgi:hypothetical protein